MSEQAPPVDSLPSSRAERRAFTRSRSNDDIYTYDSRVKPAENPIEKPEIPCGEKREKPLEKIEKLEKDEKTVIPFEKRCRLDQIPAGAALSLPHYYHLQSLHFFVLDHSRSHPPHPKAL